ncbi:hypothetical protein MFLAVUS_010725 [Mucor flavus]|uniref:Uncharacterized protein n=1 Tax=Mucor flavus TaxID=439312 RepID=A0ABP9ZDH5_9FUNG
MVYEDQKLPKSNNAVIRWFRFDQFVPETAVTSHWVSSKTFFTIRSVLALYSFIVMWVNIGFTASEGNGDSFFAFFTNLTFVGLHAYLITATVHHFRYLHNKNVNSFLDQYAVLNYLYVFLYCTVISFNIVTPVVYWSLLSKGAGGMSPRESWLNVSVHGVSFFLMIFDVIFNRMKAPLRMIIFVLFTVLVYMCLAFVVHATQGYWVYPFLNWEQGPKAAIWYVAVAAIVIVSYLLQVLIHFLRDFVARKMGKSESSQRVEDGEAHNHAMTKIETTNSSVV